MDNNMMNELYSIGLIPVIKIENPDDAVPLAKALIDGGLPAAEITFRTACAAEAIKNITETYPEMLVGAGTVLTTEQVDAAIAAGSKFLVSPGLNPKVTAYCLSKAHSTHESDVWISCNRAPSFICGGKAPCLMLHSEIYLGHYVIQIPIF